MFGNLPLEIFCKRSCICQWTRLLWILCFRGNDCRIFSVNEFVAEIAVENPFAAVCKSLMERLEQRSFRRREKCCTKRLSLSYGEILINKSDLCWFSCFDSDLFCVFHPFRGQNRPENEKPGPFEVRVGSVGQNRHGQLTTTVGKYSRNSAAARSICSGVFSRTSRSLYSSPIASYLWTPSVW